VDELMYQLREANENDYDFIFNLFKTVYKDYVIKFWNGRDDEFQKHFYKNRFKPEKIQIILDSEREIGVLELLEKEYQIYIEEIQIEPNSQNRDIGTEIINDIKKTAFKSNYSVGLMVLKINNKAKKLYEKLEFNVVGETESDFIMEALKR
jgi:ribosomal protein S18 acetylase RimI-like enzyme